MKRNKALVKYLLRLFHRMFDLLVWAFSDMLFAEHHGQPIAGVVAICSKDVVYYFHGGSASEYLHLRPNHLLFHRAIQVAKEKDKSYLDFFGSDKRLVSSIRFKDK